MASSNITVLFFILSCGLWVAGARKYNSILSVPNGGRWGHWGPPQFCYRGHAIGFGIKVEPYGTSQDSTALNAIALLCDDGKKITCTSGPWGTWQKTQYCPQGKLVGFMLRVQEEISGDNTAVNNIAFLCSDKTIMIGYGMNNGKFSPLLSQCAKGFICGIQTKVQTSQYTGDDTTLNDVKMFCCD